MIQVWKKKIGISIKFYRTLFRQKDERYNQELFYYSEEKQQQICSNKTITKLERGIPVLDDEIYRFAADKLGFLYAHNNKIDVYWQKFIEQLYVQIEIGNDEEIIALLEKGINQLKYCKKQFVYCEYLWLLQLLYQYYKDNIEVYFDYEYKKMKCLYAIFDPKVQDIISNLLYLKAMHMGYVYRKQVIEEYHLEQSNFLLHKINVLYFKAVQFQENDYKQCIQLEKELFEKENYLRLLDVYPILGGIALTTCNKEKAGRYYEKMKLILENNTIPSRKKRQAYINLGLGYMRMKEYEQAILWWEKVEHHSKLWKSLIYPCICNCYLRSSNKIPQEYRNDGLWEHKHGNMNQMIFTYLLEYQSLTIKERKQYIIGKVIPKLELSEISLIHILAEELLYLCKLDHNYHSYGLFMSEFISKMYR